MSENGELKTSYATLEKEFRRLRGAYDEANEKLAEMEKPPKRPDGDQQKELNDIKAQYQAAVRKYETVAGKVEMLNRENVDLKNRLSNMDGSRGDLDMASKELAELQTQYQALGQENQKLQTMLQTSAENEGQFNDKITMLSEENDSLRRECEMASQKNVDLGGQITELSSQNEGYVTSINSLKSAANKKMAVKETPPKFQRRKVGPVDNSQITKLNAELEDENSLLAARVSELQEKLDAKVQTPAVASSVPALPIVANAGSKYNVKYWIIPFMLLGLGVGLYTYFMEEYRITPRDGVGDGRSLER